ncbi:MAG TPA: toxic anion resistance protein [Candidatus Dormibacteraeota bacterium]
MSEERLVLTPPAAVPAVSPEQAAASAEVDAATAAKIEATVAAFVDGLAALDPHSPDFQKKVDSVSQLGNQEIRESAEMSNRFLERPAAAMDRGPLGAGSQVSRSLVELRRQLEDLDPSRQKLLDPPRLLGKLPFGNRLRDYFHRYESAQKNIDGVLQSLYRGQDELVKDDAAIDQEKLRVWEVKGRLEQYSYMCQKLDDALTAKIEGLRGEDPERARALEENVLFYVRQKRQDILTQLAVNMQGYLALDIVRKNNVELVKGVDRATTTTISALRTAVIVAQALSNQRLVLNQITALNTTTGNLIESTSRLLHDQSADIQKQSAAAAVDVRQLQAAFNNIYATIDAIDTYKLQALDTMKQTIATLSGEVARAQGYIDRAQQAQAGAALTSAGELKLPAGGR